MVTIVDRARPLVVKAAETGVLPTGSERHDWVTNQLLPEVNKAAGDAGLTLLDQIKVAVVNIGVFLAYKKEQPNLPTSGTIPPVA